MHLFVSFILKAIAVFVKDVVLYEFGEVDNCSLGSVSLCVYHLITFIFIYLIQIFKLNLLTITNQYEVQTLFSVRGNVVFLHCFHA